MAGQNRGLGRGLDALLGGARPKTAPTPAAKPSEATGAEDSVSTLSIESVRPNPRQPRHRFDEEALADLSRSIKDQGVLQPILVRPFPGPHGQQYQIVAGERRWRASRMAGLTEIPALVRDMTEEECLAVALIENLQREDLSPIEEAKGLKELQTRFNMSQDELARRVGKSRSAVANTLRLLQLSESAQKSLEEGRISAGHARALMAVSDPEASERLRERIEEASLSVREAEAEVARFKRGEAFSFDAEKPAAGRTPKPVADPGLVEAVKQLAENSGLKLKIKGSGEKGSLSLAYSSADELQALLGRLAGGAS